MGLFQIIDDKAQWGQILKSFKEVDLYYSYEYGNLTAEKEQGILLAAYYENESTKIIYPFIKRIVDCETEVMFDIVTPYGYGGPLLEGNSQELVEFYKCFENYCNENEIITETIRFHPINRNHELCKNILEVEYIRKTAAVDLTPPIEQIRQEYSSMNKRNIKKAKEAGLICYVAENSPENIYTFIELYKETMARNNADEYYYFDNKYFFELVKKTNVSSTYLLFVSYDAEIIAAVMVLIGPTYSHYHLGASRTDYLYLKPNNLLFDFMIEVSKAKGAKLLHLGGGYRENDGLFKFKSSFSNEKHFDYYIGKKIHDVEKYRKITNEVTNHYKVNESYFPIYRGKKEYITNTLS